MRPPSSALFLRAYRAGIVLAIGLLVHDQTRWLESHQGHAISFERARQFFPKATRVKLYDAEQALFYATDSQDKPVGALLTTSPFSDHIIGYAGPNNLFLALDEDGALAGVELIKSGDTQEHVDLVLKKTNFLASFLGWNPAKSPLPEFDAVSGATLTSFAMAETIQTRLQGSAPSLRFPDPLSLEQIQKLFPNAIAFAKENQRYQVLDGQKNLLGYVVRTSPQTDNLSGYRGPTETWIGLAPDGQTVTALVPGKSYDTPSYVSQVARHKDFLPWFIGKTTEQIANLDYDAEQIEGVSGATETSFAMTEGMKRRFGAAMTSARNPGKPWWKTRDWMLAGVLFGALIMAFTPLRGSRPIRWAWQAGLIVYVGLISNDLLSLALLGGWMTKGLAWQSSPGLVLLAGAALILPWTTRRQVYCHQICPHGAAQQWLGSLGHLVLRKSRNASAIPTTTPTPSPTSTTTRVASRKHRLQVMLEKLPVLLLALALMSLLLGGAFSLINLEPFDAWALETIGGAALVIAVVGLVASFFIPQAYCRFGCPTGALLNFVRRTGSADHWCRRDGIALGFLILGLFLVTTVRLWPRTDPSAKPVTLEGKTMGTTWSIKFKGVMADFQSIQKELERELTWAENMTSHWQTNNDLAIFNRTRSTNLISVPWPVVTLARRSAEISRQTEGAFDITVGPAVRLWGFGPGDPRQSPPLPSAIEQIKEGLGWEKLEILEGQLRKHHPTLEIDLSSIAKGWAIDQLVELLDYKGYTNYLLEVGGELRARGSWQIAMDHPPRKDTLNNQALATSGTYRQNFVSQGQAYSHLIDPRTAAPARHLTVSVSVRHENCADADAWATALNILGQDQGLPLANQLGLAAQFVTKTSQGNLQLQATTNWNAMAASPE